MKQITYAGESVLTSDEIGTVLVELTAALAKKGLAEAVVIPICDPQGGDHRTAELVIGQGNDVLAVPKDGDAEEPDFSAEVEGLRAKLDTIERAGRSRVAQQPHSASENHESDLGFDYDSL